MKGKFEFNRVNNISRYITHLKKAHGANPAAKFAVMGLEAAKEKRKMTGPRLDVHSHVRSWTA